MSDNVIALQPQPKRGDVAGTEDLFGGDLPIATAIEKLRTRLLDLTSRNRLLNYRHPKGKSLQVVGCDFDAVYHRLGDGKRCSFVPVPAPGKLEYEGSRPDARTHAQTLGWDVSLELAPPRTDLPTTASSGATLRALYYPEDLDRLLRTLYREARLAMEETGSNILYLVFGFLEFQEAAHSERTLAAPLIAMPVALEREARARPDGFKRFELFYTGDDFAENLTLREKLRADFGLYLPAFEEDDTPEDYLAKVEDLARDRIGWRVKRQISLALLSFGKLALWADLDLQRWPELAAHPAIKTLIQGNTRELGTPLNDPEIEKHPTAEGLIFDADSSQHVALLNVLEGRNLVVNGPPGTGKSQTITNLIALAMAAGKDVLFVSEKMAALEVVKSRLEKAGLGAFCLELHSHKTKKQRVLEELKERMQMSFPPPTKLAGKLASLQQRQAALRRYCELANLVTGNALDLSVYEIFWAADRRRADLGELAVPVETVTVKGANEIGPEGLSALRSVVERLARHYAQVGEAGPEHPWHGFFATRLAAGDELEIRELLTAHVATAKELETERQALLVATSEDEAAGSREYCHRLSRALERVPLPGPDVDGELAARLMPSQTQPLAHVAQVVGRFCGTLEELRKLTQTVAKGLMYPELASDTVLAQAQSALRDLRIGGLDEKPLAEATSKALYLRQLITEARDEFTKIDTLAQRAGVSFERSARGIAHLAALASTCVRAPEDLLPYRSPGFAQPLAGEVAARARRECAELSAALAHLEEHFFLDPPVDEGELHRALQVLREGDGLLRWLSPEYRAARRFHRRLCRAKKRGFQATVAVEELERLIKVLGSRRNFIENREYKDAFRSLFKGLATDFERIDGLVNWYRASVERLFGLVELPAVTLTELPVESVKQLARLSAAIEAAVVRLSDLRVEMRTLLHIEEATNADWEPLLTLAANRADAWERAQAFLVPLAAGGATPMEVYRGLQAQLALPATRLAAESDSEAQSLLGPYFSGPDTRLETLEASWTWVCDYAKSDTPPGLTPYLLTQELPDRLPWLHSTASRMLALWEEIDRLPTALSGFGPFDTVTWMSPYGEAASYPKPQSDRAEKALAAMDELLPWVQYQDARRNAIDKGLGAFAELLAAGRLPADRLAEAFEFAFYASLGRGLSRTHPELASFSSTGHQQARQEFQELDREVIKLNGRRYAHEIASRVVPEGTAGYRQEDFTEKQLLLREINKKKKHIALRQLIRRAGQAIQALKPCFMMGPLSVAQYLDPTAINFDLVVMDEASQVRPEEAIGAIARAKQLVIVGDPNQLPPTSFFERLVETDDEEDEDEGVGAFSGTQSILDVCEQFYPNRKLNWHYRSQHHSLIAFSNAQFYDGHLIVFPSPYEQSRHLGVYYHRVAGDYQNRQNLPEARRVVDAVVEHMIRHPKRSLGVVTLNLTQRDLIDELLEQRLRSFKEGDEFLERWERGGWPFFVKNLENVQGDERDVIFISTTFGPAGAGGRVRQNFGPISRPEGWRRLNVLFTRARQSVHLYTSLEPGDIVVDDTTPRGTQELRNYLEYARSGKLAKIKVGNGEPQSDFEVAVAHLLESRGYGVVPQLGVAGYFVDIAVRNPDRSGEFLAAIECDGATYHSGRSVRDRDRIRQEILEQLGWRIFRIWSTDWFRNRAREAAKLLEFLDRLRKEAAATPQPEREPLEAEPQPAAIESAAPLPIHLEVQPVRAEELYVEVGDLVTYCFVDKPEERLRIRIVDGAFDAGPAEVHEYAPLGKALLDLEVGDENELVIQDKPTRKLRLLKIDRTRSAPDSGT